MNSQKCNYAIVALSIQKEIFPFFHFNMEGCANNCLGLEIALDFSLFFPLSA